MRHALYNFENKVKHDCLGASSGGSIAFALLFVFVLGQITVGFINAIFTSHYLSQGFFGIAKSASILMYCVFSEIFLLKTSLNKGYVITSIVCAFLVLFIVISAIFFYLFSSFSPLTYLGGFLYRGIVEGVWGVESFLHAFGAVMGS